MSPAWTNDFRLEREALTMTFSVKRFPLYVIRQSSEIHYNYNTLLIIMVESRVIQQLSSRRQHCALILDNYCHIMKHIPRRTQLLSHEAIKKSTSARS